MHTIHLLIALVIAQSNISILCFMYLSYYSYETETRILLHTSLDQVSREQASLIKRSIMLHCSDFCQTALALDLKAVLKISSGCLLLSKTSQRHLSQLASFRRYHQQFATHSCLVQCIFRAAYPFGVHVPKLG